MNRGRGLRVILFLYRYNTIAHGRRAVHGNGALSWKMPTGFRKSWLTASL